MRLIGEKGVDRRDEGSARTSSTSKPRDWDPWIRINATAHDLHGEIRASPSGTDASRREVSSPDSSARPPGTGVRRQYCRGAHSFFLVSLARRKGDAPRPASARIADRASLFWSERMSCVIRARNGLPGHAQPGFEPATSGTGIAPGQMVDRFKNPPAYWLDARRIPEGHPSISRRESRREPCRYRAGRSAIGRNPLVSRNPDNDELLRRVAQENHSWADGCDCRQTQRLGGSPNHGSSRLSRIYWKEETN
jgi:hypothetical protein